MVKSLGSHIARACLLWEESIKGDAMSSTMIYSFLFHFRQYKPSAIRSWWGKYFSPSRSSSSSPSPSSSLSTLSSLAIVCHPLTCKTFVHLTIPFLSKAARKSCLSIDPCRVSKCSNGCHVATCFLLAPLSSFYARSFSLMVTWDQPLQRSVSQSATSSPLALAKKSMERHVQCFDVQASQAPWIPRTR